MKEGRINPSVDIVRSYGRVVTLVFVYNCTV